MFALHITWSLFLADKYCTCDLDYLRYHGSTCILISQICNDLVKNSQFLDFFLIFTWHITWSLFWRLSILRAIWSMLDIMEAHLTLFHEICNDMVKKWSIFRLFQFLRNTSRDQFVAGLVIYVSFGVFYILRVTCIFI